jgi:hypothetical protein
MLQQEMIIDEPVVKADIIEEGGQDEEAMSECWMTEDTQDDVFDITENSTSALDDILFDQHDFSDIESDCDDTITTDEVEVVIPDTPYRNKLKEFVVAYRFKHYQIKGLLEFLRTNDQHFELPRSAVTLLNFSKLPLQIRDVPPSGQYHHIGIINSLKTEDYPFLKEAKNIQIDVCIDGVPLVKSSKLCMWPILAAFVNRPDVKPFLIGLYVGYGSPKSIEHFLEDFVQEILSIKEKGGIEINGKLIPFEIRAFCCDAPARAFLCGIKYHTAFHGCSKCAQIGYREGGKRGTTVYQNIAGEPRSDESFLHREDPEHHNPLFLEEPNPLEILDIGMVSQVPIEPMHLLDLGVMKKLLVFYISNKGNRFFPSKQAVIETEKLFLAIKPFVPAEFSRGPRNFYEVPRYKATEFRQFLLYTGPVVLKPFMKPEQYDIFLYFHCAVRLMYLSDKLDEAQQLMELFVENFSGPFPQKALTYNVHSLLHLGESVRAFGLESMSNYKYENFMQSLKASINSSTNVIRQISNSIQLGKFLKTHPGASKSSKFDTIVLNSKLKNNHCLLNDGSIIEIISVREGYLALGNEYPKTSISDFYSLPFESGVIDCYIVDSKIERTEKVFSIQNDVKFKFFRMPYGEGKFVLMPMIHSV